MNHLNDLRLDLSKPISPFYLFLSFAKLPKFLNLDELFDMRYK